jgi:hypothetical protein
MNSTRFLTTSAVVASFFLAISVSPGAHAVPTATGVSDAQYNLQAGTQFRVTAGSVSNSGGVATGDPFGPLVEASGVTFPGLDSRYGTSSARIQYSFEVTGGTSSTIVPILISGAWDAIVFGTAVAAGQLTTSSDPYFRNATRDLVFICHEADACTGANFTIPEHVISNVEWTILITAAGAAGTSGSYWAFVDPVITIDPSFAQASDYSLIFSSNVSPGVGNPLAVPEPEEYILMLVGLGLIGAITKWRKQQNVSSHGLMLQV